MQNKLKTKNVPTALTLMLFSVFLAATFILVGAHEAAAQLTCSFNNARCILDVDPVDDEPGQKDLNQVCASDADPLVDAVQWNLDEITGFSGNNTGDACALYDTDLDGNINYALCVTVQSVWVCSLDTSENCTSNNGGPVQQICTDADAGECIEQTEQIDASPRLYSCGDDKDDRCTQQVVEQFNFGSDCESDVIPDSDPFWNIVGHEGADGTPPEPPDSQDDTVSSCCIVLSDVGNGTLANVCSYPSEQPNSDPSDCVFIPGSGFITIVKECTNDPLNDDQFDFTVDSQGATLGCEEQVRLPLASGFSYDANESTPPADWTFDSATCVDADGIEVGTSTSTGVSGIEVVPGDEITCTFANSFDPCFGVVCNDGATCTTDTCVDGDCVYTPIVDFCNDNEYCTDDTCDPGDPDAFQDTGCLFVGNNNEGCFGGACIPENDGNVCTDDTCIDTGDGVIQNHDPVADSTPCEDGDACTSEAGTPQTLDHCFEGVCTGIPVDCSSLDNQCNVGTCDPSDGACVADPKAESTPCEDGDYCTSFGSVPGDSDHCDGAGFCVGTPVDCGPGDQCNTNECNEATDQCEVVFVAESTPCEDGDFCTSFGSVPGDSDHCDGAGSCVGTPVDCGPGDQCNTNECNEATDQCEVVFVAESTPCEDGDFCTSFGSVPGDSDHCDGAGSCVGTPVDCGPGDQCNTNECNEATDQCEVVFVAESTPCEDGDFCTSFGSVPGDSDHCDGAGSCVGTPVDCGPGDQCNDDVCNEDTDACEVVLKADSTPCEDGEFCTSETGAPQTPDHCEAGVCVGVPVDCDDDNLCTNDSCDEVNDTCVNAFDPENDLVCAGICRTQGFWGNRAGNEKGGCNYTQAMLDAAFDELDGCIEVCGNTVCGTEGMTGDLGSAIEGLCVKPLPRADNPNLENQLYRAVLTATLNCVLSGAGLDQCDTLIDYHLGDGTWDYCSQACADPGDPEFPRDEAGECYEKLDCWNNGFYWVDDGFVEGCAFGTCSVSGEPCEGKDFAECPEGEVCYQQNFCHDLGICDTADSELLDTLVGQCGPEGLGVFECFYDTEKLGPAGSSRECNAATKSKCSFAQPGYCADPSACEDEDVCPNDINND